MWAEICYMLGIEDWDDWLGTVPRQAWLPHTVGVAIMCSQPCSEGPCIRCKAWNLWRMHVKAKTYWRILDTSQVPERGHEPPSSRRSLTCDAVCHDMLVLGILYQVDVAPAEQRGMNQGCVLDYPWLYAVKSQVWRLTRLPGVYTNLSSSINVVGWILFSVSKSTKACDHKISKAPLPKLQTRGSRVKWRFLLARDLGMCIWDDVPQTTNDFYPFAIMCGVYLVSSEVHISWAYHVCISIGGVLATL